MSAESNSTPECRALTAARDAALNYARRLVGQSDCEDVAQEVMLRVLPLWQSDPTRCSISYVLSITHNVAMNLLTCGDRKRRSEVPTQEVAAKPCGPVASEVAEVAAGLQPAAYHALVLTEVKGLSDEQVAKSLNVSRSLVGAKRRAAIDALRGLSQDAVA